MNSISFTWSFGQGLYSATGFPHTYLSLIYCYIHGKCSDGLHTSIPSVLSFTLKTRHESSMESKHTYFLHVKKCKKVPDTLLLQKNCHSAEQISVSWLLNKFNPCKSKMFFIIIISHPHPYNYFRHFHLYHTPNYSLVF